MTLNPNASPTRMRYHARRSHGGSSGKKGLLWSLRDKTSSMIEPLKTGSRLLLRAVSCWRIHGNAARGFALGSVFLAVSYAAMADNERAVFPTYANWDGSYKYEYVITAEMVDRAAKWNPASAPTPPLSRTEAIARSRGCIAKIPPGRVDLTFLSATTEDYWALAEVKLQKVLDGWAWTISYQLTSNGPMTGYWPTMDCWILMDGSVLTPQPGSFRLFKSAFGPKRTSHERQPEGLPPSGGLNQGRWD